LNTHSILIVDESDSDPELRYKPFTDEEVVAVTTVAPVKTAADRALATFKVKKPRLVSPEPKFSSEEQKKEQAKTQTSMPSNRTSVNSDKPPLKPAPAPKPTRKNMAQKNPVQRSTTKGKEKAEYTPSSKSTSVTTETDSPENEDQIMGEIDEL
jgi:outer membrane biosynthesis protein TonB